MAWTDPTTRSASEYLDKDDWNTDIVNNLAYLIAVVEPNTLTNNSGGALSAGAVVVIDASADNAFTTTTSADDEDIMGVVAETIAASDTGRVAVFGLATVNVQGNVTRGHYLSTSTTAGRAKDAGTTPSNATFAIALTGYAGGGAGTVTALLLPSMAGDAVPANLIAYTTDGSAPSGFSEYTAARGRVIVGLPSSGTNEGTVGSALSDQQNPQHLHSFSDVIDHVHTMEYDSGGGGGWYVQLGNGVVAGQITTESIAPSTATETLNGNAVMPYIQLMTIAKD